MNIISEFMTHKKVTTLFWYENNAGSAVLPSKNYVKVFEYMGTGTMRPKPLVNHICLKI